MRSTGKTKSRAAGAIPRKLAFGTEPEALVTVEDCAPLPAMVPATCVPCPSAIRQSIRISRSHPPCQPGWVASTPVSLTFTNTPSPVKPR